MELFTSPWLWSLNSNNEVVELTLASLEKSNSLNLRHFLKKKILFGTWKTLPAESSDQESRHTTTRTHRRTFQFVLLFLFSCQNDVVYDNNRCREFKQKCQTVVLTRMCCSFLLPRYVLLSHLHLLAGSAKIQKQNERVIELHSQIYQLTYCRQRRVQNWCQFISKSGWAEHGSKWKHMWKLILTT